MQSGLASLIGHGGAPLVLQSVPNSNKCQSWGTAAWFSALDGHPLPSLPCVVTQTQDQRAHTTPDPGPSHSPASNSLPTRGAMRTRPDDAASIIAPEGLPIVAGFVLVGLVLSAASLFWLGLFGIPIVVVAMVLCLWCVWFFRDPQRPIPTDPGLVICPADGVTCLIGPAAPPPEIGAGTEPLSRVCVFMNVFDVHVNRSPLAGIVEKVAYRPGTFFNASFDKASDLNERMSLLIKTPASGRIVVVQIAGLVARRIVCRVKEGATLKAGERFGLIRFGSRVDVYLPAGAVVGVKVGDRVSAGSSILGTVPTSPQGAA